MKGKMTLRPWEAAMPEADLALYQKLQYGSRQAYGTRPALLIIDVNRAFVGSKPMPVMQAVDEHRMSCGEAAWAALPNIRKLLDACRAERIPVFFTTNDAVSLQFCRGATKLSAGSAETADLQTRLKSNEIAAEIAPLPSELVIKKTKANAFWGTPLLSCLQAAKTDCLLVAGCVTSGCVRATVIDAWDNGFPCFVVEECVFDRFQLSHLVSLFDLNAKYADVITLEEALGYVAKVKAKVAG